ncbi:hypothetical protein WDW37_19025 [Bdellovibrionota bacterium FG-1]
MSFEAQLLKCSPQVLTAVIEKTGVTTLAMALFSAEEDLLIGSHGLIFKLPERLIVEFINARRFLEPIIERENLHAQEILLNLIAEESFTVNEGG